MKNLSVSVFVFEEVGTGKLKVCKSVTFEDRAGVVQFHTSVWFWDEAGKARYSKWVCRLESFQVANPTTYRFRPFYCDVGFVLEVIHRT